MPRLARVSVVLVVLVLVVASCFKGGKTPRVSAHRTLDLPAGEGAGAAPSGKFAVVFAGPRGETSDPSEVSVVFNRPMRAMDLADAPEPAPPATLRAQGATEPPRGSWRWIGTSALVFAPEPRLPRATAYTVTVPAGTRALDGSTLDAPYAFDFSTPPPHLVRVDSGSGRALVPSSTFELRFDQPVEPGEVQRATRLVAGDKELPFRVTRPKSDTPTLVKLAPAAPLPLASEILVKVDGSLRGTEGPLTLGAERVEKRETYGPLDVAGMECSTSTPHGKCAAGGYLSLRLTNRVTFASLKAHVRVEGSKVKWSDARGDDLLDAWSGLDAPLEPAHGYAIVVTKGLKDEYGQTLARDVRLPFETDDEWPALALEVSGGVYEAASAGAHGRAREVPVASVNMPAYDLVTAPLDEAQVAALVTGDTKSDEERFNAAAAVPGAKRDAIRPKEAANAVALTTVRLDDLLEKSGGRGVALVAVHPGDTQRSSPDARVLAVTDLGISAKMSRFGSLVWVTRLSDGSPVVGAKVSVRTAARELTSATTDADGVAAIAAKDYAPIGAEGSNDRTAIVVARKDGDWTFRPVASELSPWMYAPSDPSGRLDPMGMLFTDRGIYKTGEKARVKGTFRLPLAHGTATPKGRAVKLTASDATGTSIFEGAATLDAFGQFSLEVPIPAGAHLGTMDLRAELAKDGDSPRGGATVTAELAAYRPAEFKVQVAPEKASYVRGDKASFVTRGDYLFGAPMGAGEVRFTVTRGRTSFTPPGTEGLVVDDATYAEGRVEDSPRAGEIESGNGGLDPKGAFAASASLALPHQQGAEVVSFESEVTDVSRQAIAGRASVIVHPAEVYVALDGPKDLFVTKGTTLQPAVAAVEPGGRHREGVRVKLELVKRTWTSAYEASGEDGHQTSSQVDTSVASCEVATTKELAGCDLPASDSGYFVLRASARDRRGNPVAASTPVYVVGDASDVGWRLDDTSKLELVTDKKQYEVGDVAQVLVKSPFPAADALVTVERAGVYRRERKDLAGAMPTLSIPITEDMRPNAFVAVHLVRGRTKDAPAHGADVGAPAFRLGYAELVVNPEARRLHVAVKPAKKQLRPGDEVDAEVALTDRAGHGVKGEVTFYAVDEGVLSLTGYRTPDPIPAFTAPRPLNVVSLESRSDLARVLAYARGVGVDKGDEGGGGGGTRADFRSTAFFEPALVTDDAGRAHVKFKLPDSLTTYRLMAVASAEDDRFGHGEAQVIVSRPLMARPNLPRFLRAGDEIDAGVVLSSKGLPAMSVEVSLEAKGVTVRGDATRTVALPANGSVEVRWPLQAPLTGEASFTFHARAGDEKDDVAVTRTIEAPISPEAVALYGDTKGGAEEKLGDLRGMRPDVGGLDVRLASTALVGLDDGIEQLVEYPYGCTEQLTSRLVPLVPLRQLAADYRVALPADLAPVIDKAVAAITQNQRDDGGFGWWPDDRHSDPWLTAYALWGLEVARKGGAFVPEPVTAGAARFLRARLAAGAQPTPRMDAEAAFLVDVLAQIGAPDPGYESQLYARKEKLPLFARALLAHAMVTTKGTKSASAPGGFEKQAADLTRDFEAHLRVTGAGATVVENLGDDYAVMLDSEARTTAMVLRALIAVDPKHPLAARLAKGLLALRQHGTWRSTQETAWALLALDDYRRAQESETPEFDARVFLGGAQAYEAPFRERSVVAQTTHIPAEKLVASGSGAPLGIEVDGSGTLFYEARLRYAKTELPAAGIDRGFFVRKLVRSVRPEALKDALATIPSSAATGAGAGDLVLVDLLVVSSTPREQVVVDDPLPAGLEAVQASLATTARSLDVAESGGAGDAADAEASDDDAVASGRAWGEAWFHREYKDDRVLTFVDHLPAGMFHYRYLARATTRGRFVVPPTRVECMYEPETFGRTGATTFEVR